MNIGGGISSLGAHISLGPQVGYQILVANDRVAIDGAFQIGFGMFTDGDLDGSGVGAGVNINTALGVGYVF